MNDQFKRMKEGSERLHQMEQDVRWFTRTLAGILNELFKGFGAIEAQTHVSLGHVDERVLLVYRAGEFIFRCRMNGRDYSLVNTGWTPDDIKMIHGHLDALLDVSRDFCRRFGSRELFDQKVRALTAVLD
jgi:hypothetical protein